MKYYKNELTSKVFAYEQNQLDNPIVVKAIKNMKEMTEEEIELLLNPIVSNEDLIKSKRAERDNIINSFSWRIERNSQELELNLETTDNRLDLLNYMQYLRDIPNDKKFPNIEIKTYDEFLEHKEL